MLTENDELRIVDRLRSYREGLEARIRLLESGNAELRIRHEGAWVDGTSTVLANLYRQLGDLNALIHDILSQRRPGDVVAE